MLFGLNDDELLPNLHITRAGVLRAGIGAHQEHVVDQDAHAADRRKVPAEVIQVASHQVDTDSDKDESIVATSGSEGSESASDHWPLMLNSMSACKPPILQWVVTLTTKRPLSGLSTTSSSVWSWFLNDGPLRDSPSLCKNVLTILTVC